MDGYLALILTAHVPYVRAAGRQPEGEDLLHETIAYALVPALNVLYDLHEQGVRPNIAIAYSPVLLEQLADSVVQKHFVVWMDQWLSRTADVVAHCEQTGDTHRAYLAHFYFDWGQGIARSFSARYGRNLVAALRELCSDGRIEPLSGAATHAYLPLLGSDETIYAQLNIGKLSVAQRLGCRPHGLWLPECGYHPNLKQHISATASRYFIADQSSVADPPVAHLRPHWVAPQRLAVFIHDEQAGQHAWSVDLGYPGDPLYLAPQREAQSGLAWWRNGLAGAHAQELYDPYHAFRRAQEHASHFSTVVSAELAAFHQREGRPGIVVVPLDAELIGRRWFEGPAWLRALLMAHARHQTVPLTTPSAYLRAHRPRRGIALREGCWSLGADPRRWTAGPAYSLWQALLEAGERLTAVVQHIPNATGVQERVLAQAARELLLAQSSDWPVLLSQGIAAQEALARPLAHLHRCERLCQMAGQEELTAGDVAFLEEVEELDNPFPDLNYRVFAVE